MKAKDADAEAKGEKNFSPNLTTDARKDIPATPGYKTITQAAREGFKLRKNWEYGGEETVVKGRLLVRHPKEAYSKTEWSKRGFRLSAGAKPHCVRTVHMTKAGKSIKYAVYREDQVEPNPNRHASERRRQGARKGIETKRRRLLDEIEAIQIDFPRMDEATLTRRAVDHYNERSFNTLRASVDSDLGFLNRITVNYLRHSVTDYDELLEEYRGKVGTREAYISLKEKILEAIAEAHPHLAFECDRQIHEANYLFQP